MHLLYESAPQGTQILAPKHGTKILDSTGQVLETIDPQAFANAGSKARRKMVNRTLDNLGVTNRRERQRVLREMKGVQLHKSGDSIPDYTITPPKDLKVFNNSTTVDTRTPLSDIVKPGSGVCTLATCTEIK